MSDEDQEYADHSSSARIDDQDSNGYIPFRNRGGHTAKGTLYRIEPMKGDQRERLTNYVNNGIMNQDLRFARDVWALMKAVGKSDFDLFWESPWDEEHVKQTARKRKLNAAERSMAVRTFIRNTTSTGAVSSMDTADVDKFLSTVDRLTEWQDRHGEKNIVKTVSRFVQAFERVVITTMLEKLETPGFRNYSATVGRVANPVAIWPSEGVSISSVACTLRRADKVFQEFAAAVAAEMTWTEGTGGTRTTSIHLCKRLEEKRDEAYALLIRKLNSLDDLPHDKIGLPLMEINASMCVSKGVLVVMPGSMSATYILDLEEGLNDIANVKQIKIVRVVQDNKNKTQHQENTGNDNEDEEHIDDNNEEDN